MLAKKKMMGSMFRSCFLCFFFILLVLLSYRLFNFDNIFSSLMHSLFIIVITYCIADLLAYLIIDTHRRVMRMVLCSSRFHLS